MCENKEELWVKWEYTVILKGKSLWEPRTGDSWPWKRILCVRNQYTHCINKVIGNGQTTSFWYNPWHPWRILNVKHPELKRKLQITDDVNFATVLEGRLWKLSFGRGWDNQIIQFNQARRDIELMNGEDRESWIPRTRFSIKSATSAHLPLTDCSNIV